MFNGVYIFGILSWYIFLDLKVYFLKTYLIYLGFIFFSKTQRMGALLQKKNFILLPFAAECHIQGANANSPKYKLRLTIHSEMCVAWSTPAHHSCPSGTVTYLRILSGINLCTSAFKLSTASQCGLEHTPNIAVNYSQSLYNIKSCCILGLCSGFYISLLHMPSPPQWMPDSVLLVFMRQHCFCVLWMQVISSCCCFPDSNWDTSIILVIGTSYPVKDRNVCKYSEVI